MSIVGITPTLRCCHGSVAADGKDRSPSAGGLGMHVCALDQSGDRIRSRDREWVSRALVHTPRRRLNRDATACLAGVLMLVMSLSGCTHFKEYIHSGFKVG